MVMMAAIVKGVVVMSAAMMSVASHFVCNSFFAGAGGRDICFMLGNSTNYHHTPRH
jgi:hypothetical protein